MERQCLLSLESWFWFPCNSFVMCNYRPRVVFSFVMSQHRRISLIIMFQAFFSSILFEHIVEALITFIQLLLFQKVVLLERQGLSSLESWFWFPCNSFVMCKYRLWVMFPVVTCKHRLISVIFKLHTIISSILFEHIVEALITIKQLFLF